MIAGLKINDMDNKKNVLIDLIDRIISDNDKYRNVFGLVENNDQLFNGYDLFRRKRNDIIFNSYKKSISQISLIDNLNGDLHELKSIIVDDEIKDDFIVDIQNRLLYLNEYKNISNLLRQIEYENYVVKVDNSNFNPEDIDKIRAVIQFESYVLSMLNVLSKIKTIGFFNNLDTSAVLIGANGSGKSSFSRNIRNDVNDKVAFIQSQKSFDLYLNDTVSLKSSYNKEKYLEFLRDEKLGKEYNDKHQNRTLDFTQLMNVLISDFIYHIKNSYDENKKTGLSILEKVIEIWNSIIKHRKLLITQEFEVKVCYSGNKSNEIYEFPKLSDGEKAVFYYVGNVLLVEKGSSIVVDEPENHLNLSIVNELWDKLENVRNDCKFIYLTHDVSFASSRYDTRKFWIKNYNPPSDWELIELRSNDNLPDELLFELLGSRKSIIFCEGNDSSVDIKILSILFPECLIKYVEGHVNVVNYTRALNRLRNDSGLGAYNSVYGIIDSDYYTKEQLKKYKEDKIYHIETVEVENILCDSDLIKRAIDQYDCTSISFNEIESYVKDKFIKDKEHQVAKYVTSRINEYLRSNMINTSTNIKDLTIECDSLIKGLTYSKWFDERMKYIEDIIDRNDYNEIIKNYESKGLVHEIGNYIVKNYKNRVIKLLGKEENNELRDNLKQKYFSELSLVL